MWRSVGFVLLLMIGVVPEPVVSQISTEIGEEGPELSFDVTDEGCIAFSVSDGFEHDLIDAASFEGTGEWAGPSIELTLTLSAEASAGLDICLEIDRPFYLKPERTSGSPSQKMAVLGFWDWRLEKGVPRIRLKLEPNVEGEVSATITLEAYCLDSERKPPSDGELMLVGKPLGQQVVEFISEIDSINMRQACLWAARTYAPEFEGEVSRSNAETSKLIGALKDKEEARSITSSEQHLLTYLQQQSDSLVKYLRAQKRKECPAAQQVDWLASDISILPEGGAGQSL